MRGNIENFVAANGGDWQQAKKRIVVTNNPKLYVKSLGINAMQK